jgi:hypothetical protein
MKGEESKKPFVSGERVFEVKNGQRHNDGEVDMPSRSPREGREGVLSLQNCTLDPGSKGERQSTAV